jgi:hypothetical protein
VFDQGVFDLALWLTGSPAALPSIGRAVLRDALSVLLTHHPPHLAMPPA